MISVYFVFSCQFIIFLTSHGNVVMGSGSPALKLTIIPNKNEAVSVLLKETSQLLANKFLPVWTTDGKFPSTLQKQENVMQQVGLFKFYQDPANSAAAVIFQTQQRLRGIIDSRAIIERVPLDLKNLADTTFFKTGVKYRSSSRFFQTKQTENAPTVPAKYNHCEDKKRDEYLNEESEVTKMRRETSDWNYIEILVLVSYDMVEGLLTEPDDYSPIVSYVLTLFNNVDMLYAKIRNPPIILNLAGIVIAKTSEAFPIYEKKQCSEAIKNSDGIPEDDLDVRCTNNVIKSFCSYYAEVIPPRTYDLAILLTRFGLHRYAHNPKTGDYKLSILGGLAESVNGEYYDHMTFGTMPTLVATVSDRGEYESFPIIAHEIAHLFKVDHDEPTGETNKIMRANGKHTPKSLSWSRASVEGMRKFFESRSACIFKNLPGSLVRPGPHKIWDGYRQCRCYGYATMKNDFFNKLTRTIKDECDDNIMCEDDFGEVHEGPVYWDGTPCERNKVCWSGRCVDIRK